MNNFFLKWKKQKKNVFLIFFHIYILYIYIYIYISIYILTVYKLLDVFYFNLNEKIWKKNYCLTFVCNSHYGQR